MIHFYVYNGDADGLCALQQLRLAEPGDATLVSGVKRDIRLLKRVDAARGDRVTVLDISLDQNRAELQQLLERGVFVRYFDHHFAGELPCSGLLESYIDEAPGVCTSTLVDRYLGGRYRKWAIVAAFGDNLPGIGTDMARNCGIDEATTVTLRMLGTYLNYNAYGDSISDLHFDPKALADAMLPYADPADFVKRSDVYARLSAGYEQDMRKARDLKPMNQVPGAMIVMLPDEPWAKRAIGVYANELIRSAPDSAVAILSPNSRGGYVASVRVPVARAVGADEFCRRFETGGGRKLAGGIDHLPRAEVDHFASAFRACFGISR